MIRPLAALRHRVDRLLHPWRHRRASARLLGLARPRRILVLCHGNVCRSPFLAARLRRALQGVEVVSSGFSTPGVPMPETGITVAADYGENLSAHRSRRLTPAELQADLVFVMDARQRGHVVDRLGVPSHRVLIVGDLDPRAGDARGIEDPYNKNLAVFVSSYARLDRCAARIATLISSAGPSRNSPNS